jgi:acyl-CoA thioester hydrolase
MFPIEGVHRTEIQVRLADTDALGHVNASRYAEYAEAGRLGFFAELGQAVGSLILAHLSIDFRAQVRFGQPISVETRVERLGQSSVTLRQLVIAGGQLAADMLSVVVLFDYDRQRSRGIPAGLRERLALYLREDLRRQK